MAEKKDPMAEAMDSIRRNIPSPAIFEQLAENCSALADCALRQARIMRGDNPSKEDLVDVVKVTEEKVGDVLVTLDVIGSRPSPQLMQAKLGQWAGIAASAKQQGNVQMPDIPESETVKAEVIEEKE